MCGIFFILSQSGYLFEHVMLSTIMKSFDSIRHRGPDMSRYHISNDNTYFLGFHRLSIMDTSEHGMQPFLDNDSFFLCNGEIYNYKSLEYNENTVGHSDTLYTFNYLRNIKNLNKGIGNLDGVYSIIMGDSNRVIMARDPIGVRPLFWKTWKNSQGYKFIAAASEMKALIHLPGKINAFLPGMYMVLDIHKWTFSFTRHYEHCPNKNIMYHSLGTLNREYLIDAVKKRLDCDRPMGFLCSGGLDSAIIISIASLFLKEMTLFTIGFSKDSPDVKHARIVKDYLESRGIKVDYHEYIPDKNTFINYINDTIIQNESFDVTTTRASVPNYLIAKYISENTNIKVLFSGEGADELFGGYLYFKYAKTARDFQIETERLVNDLYMFDVLRSDRTTARHGLELRVPFLDKTFVKHVLYDLNPVIKMPSTWNGIEKYILRETFKDILPSEIYTRQKDAFSDAVGYSWVDEFNRYCNIHTDSDRLNRSRYIYDHCCPMNQTELYIRDVFEKEYTNQGHVIQYIWRPHWVDTTEPSARYLKDHISHN